MNQGFRLFDEDDDPFFFIIELPCQFIESLLTFLDRPEKEVGGILRVCHQFLEFPHSRTVASRRLSCYTLVKLTQEKHDDDKKSDIGDDLKMKQ